MLKDESILDLLGGASAALGIGVGVALLLGVDVPNPLAQATPKLVLGGLAAVAGASALVKFLK